MSEQKILIGWQEWCALPTLNVAYIKAKVDTGAKTSSLHAFNIEEFRRDRKKYISFDIHPIQDNDNIIITAKAMVTDERYVMSSSGHKEKRYVIETMLYLGNKKYNIELTLTNRDSLRFRMLLGRDALRSHCIIDPSKRSCIAKYPKSFVEKYYRTK
jgi:ribosomal protein S6--L-glutamate ligase